MLRHAVGYALRALKIQGRNVMTEQQRYEAGDLVVYELKKFGDPWKLDENMPDNHPGPRTGGWTPPQTS